MFNILAIIFAIIGIWLFIGTFVEILEKGINNVENLGYGLGIGILFIILALILD